MPDTTDRDSETIALRSRLARLAEQHSRSEIARRTGTSVANVSRYLQSTRMPAEFCAALVKHMGINPAWLLAGEGTQLLSDITAGTANMAGDLLQLVEAMNAVGQMRMGALTGKHHLRVLRELNDALGTYEKLRVRLNERSAPLFRQLLTDLRRTLDRFETIKAVELLKAADQVARLCDDAALQRELLALKAAYETFHGHAAAAADCQRRLLLYPLVQGGVINKDDVAPAYRLILNLHIMARIEEALRVTEAVLRLLPPEAPAWDDYAMLAFQQGRLKAELGDLVEGVAIMLRHLPVQHDKRQSALRLWVTTHLLRAGMLRPDDVFGFGADLAPKALVVQFWATWTEDVPYIRKALKYMEGEQAGHLGEMGRPDFYLPFLYRALADKDKKAPAEFAANSKKCIEDYAAYPQVFLAQLWRVIGNAKSARKAWEAADQAFAAVPPEIHVDLLTRGLHHRNALWLAQKSPGMEAAANAAREFFTGYARRGFACFRDQAVL
jgi:hypothetical protein